MYNSFSGVLISVVFRILYSCNSVCLLLIRWTGLGIEREAGMPSTIESRSVTQMKSRITNVSSSIIVISETPSSSPRLLPSSVPTKPPSFYHQRATQTLPRQQESSTPTHSNPTSFLQNENLPLHCLWSLSCLPAKG